MSNEHFNNEELLRVDDLVLEPRTNKLDGIGEDEHSSPGNGGNEPSDKRKKSSGPSIKVVAAVLLLFSIAFGAFLFFKKMNTAQVDPFVEQLSNGQLPPQELEVGFTDPASDMFFEPAASQAQPDAQNQAAEFTDSWEVSSPAQNLTSTTGPDDGQYVPETAPVIASVTEQQIPSQAYTLSLSEIEALRAEISALKELAQHQQVKIDMLSEPADGQFASKQAMLDSLSAIKELQTQSRRLVTAVTNNKNQIADVKKQLEGAYPQNSPSVNQIQSRTTEAPKTVELATPANREQEDNKVEVVVQQPAKRTGARELAWSSFIEDFGIATIEGTTSFVELSPGQSLLGRGTIKSISGTGCIYFTNGDMYAPTNGECKK